MLSRDELEALARREIECPKEVRHAIKALFADPAHKVACDFIVAELCGQGLLSFTMPVEPAVLMHRTGRRYVAEQLLAIVRDPIPEPQEAQPRRMTATERARRRNMPH